MAITIFAFLFIVGLVSLSSVQLWLIAINVTTLDSIKGQFRMLVNKNKPNPFDLGVFTNIALFFEYDTFWWWLPFTKYSNNDGVSYPMRPPVKRGEIIDTQNLV